MLWVPAHRSIFCPPAPGQLGQLGQVPYADRIAQVVNEIPRCFTSREALPWIARSQVFARLVPTSPLILGGPSVVASARRALDTRWWTLEYWRNRFSTETPATYCVGTTAAVHWQVTQAVAGPYIEASGIAGIQQTLDEALEDFRRDLNPLNAIPWWGWALGAAVGSILFYGVYQRVRGPRAVASVQPVVPADPPSTQVAV